MKFERQKAIMLAENINDFIRFVKTHHGNKDSGKFHLDKLLQVKLLVEEYKFQLIADELIRINQFDWDEKYTYYLVDWFIKGLAIIEEFVKINYEELFLLTARLHTLKSLSLSFTKIVPK
jgi:hypothetical protein